MRIAFAPPHNRVDAQKRSDELLVKILQIQRQLGDRNPRRDYHEWRRRTLYALDVSVLERHFLQKYIEDK